jgi:hypothetical protein
MFTLLAMMPATLVHRSAIFDLRSAAIADEQCGTPTSRNSRRRWQLNDSTINTAPSILSVVSVVERKTYFKLGFLGVTAGPCALSGDEALCFYGMPRNGSRHSPKSASDNPAHSRR